MTGRNEADASARNDLPGLQNYQLHVALTAQASIQEATMLKQSNVRRVHRDVIISLVITTHPPA
jgi:hypothetical protein